MSQKRAKEERRKERMSADKDREMYDRVEAATQDMDTMVDGPWHVCSFDTEHDDSCTVMDLEGRREYTDTQGEVRECFDMTKWEVAIHHVQSKCRAAQIDTANIRFNVFTMDTQITTIFEILKDHLNITQEDVDIVYQRVMYKALQSFYEEVRPMVEEARRESLVAKNMPKIVDSNGKPFLH